MSAGTCRRKSKEERKRTWDDHSLRAANENNLHGSKLTNPELVAPIHGPAELEAEADRKEADTAGKGDVSSFRETLGHGCVIGRAVKLVDPDTEGSLHYISDDSNTSHNRRDGQNGDPA